MQTLQQKLKTTYNKMELNEGKRMVKEWSNERDCFNQTGKLIQEFSNNNNIKRRILTCFQLTNQRNQFSDSLCQD